MGKTAELEGASLAFARSVFARYYQGHAIEPPLRLGHRELAYAPFAGSGMRRHLAVGSPSNFRELLAREVPRHAYYSSAYYEHPDHPIMVSKGWLGADVIFDLDADHLEGAERLSYPEQLERVRRQFLLLLDEFLFRDFGLDEQQVSLAFSGGRGYHAHIHAEAFLGLSSGARRELVEYLSGVGFDPTFGREHLARPRRGKPAAAGDPTAEENETEGRAWNPKARKAKERRTRQDTLPRLPPVDAPGWKGRLTRSLHELLIELKPMDLDTAARTLRARATELEVTMSVPEARDIVVELLQYQKLEKILDSGTIDIRGDPPASFLRLAQRLGMVQLKGETDAPVTTDIHRLIRLPGSLHGGTGFRVLPLRRDEIEAFRPLRDALLPAADGAPGVGVRLLQSVDYPLADARVRGMEGERLTLPEPQALFLVLRGEAVVPGADGTPADAPGG